MYERIRLQRRHSNISIAIVVAVACFITMISDAYNNNRSAAGQLHVIAFHVQQQQRYIDSTQTQPNRCKIFVSKPDFTSLCRYSRRNEYFFGISGTQHAATSNDSDDSGDGEQPPPQQLLGMADAFRQLESLKSLDDPEEYIPAPEKMNVDAVLADSKNALLQSSSTNSSVLSSEISPEQDFAIYRNMVEEIEQEEVAASYTEVLNELGGSALQTNDTYSQIMSELGGTKIIPSSATATTKILQQQQDEIPNDGAATSLSSDTNELLFNAALNEALKEVQQQMNNDPNVVNEKSMLNDKEMMREIEEIFDRGNAQLIEEIEEIRREQQQTLTASKNIDTPLGGGSVRTDDDDDGSKSDTVKRLQNAERSVESILRRVTVETTNVERAVDDLQTAQTNIENNWLLKLKRGGIPKQTSLAGFLLFSIRSIVESITAVTSSLSSSSTAVVVDSEAHLYAALAQGVVAMICAILFFKL